MSALENEVFEDVFGDIFGGRRSLRSVIEGARDETGGSLGDLTVLSVQVDPYRLDTPAFHEVGQWLADQMNRLGLMDRQLHLRGIHYALLGSTTMPKGVPYTNTGENWEWLQDKAAKAARWLGYVPFDAITDARNEEPIILAPPSKPTGYGFLSAEPCVKYPEIIGIEPGVVLTEFYGRQPYRLAFYGEKTSLAPVLRPIAQHYDADLFLPTGEISDTQMYMMAKAGADDGRKLIVFTLADFDPSGWQMSISIGRKLQALKDLQFPALEFELHPIGLTREQAIDLDLPSTPLKETEKRADKWRAAMGREQTEIDALATLRPDALEEIVEDALGPFYDSTLGNRVRRARQEWYSAAREILVQHVDHEEIARLEAEAEAELEQMREKLDEEDRKNNSGVVPRVT
ncbi:MAG TPA: hypothetical protein VF161_10965 [Steroidobacteraceae bacterium]